MKSGANSLFFCCQRLRIRIFEGTSEIQQLVIAQVISGMRVESKPYKIRLIEPSVGSAVAILPTPNAGTRHMLSQPSPGINPKAVPSRPVGTM